MFLIFRDFQEWPTIPLALTPEEFRHARARRLSPGDVIHIGNGRGLRCAGTLAADLKAVSELRREDRTEQPARPVYLCTAVPGGKRWDWLLEKAAELGVSHIIPVQYKRSDRVRFSAERAARIFEQAGAQSQSFHLPVLLPETPLSELHQALPDRARVMILEPRAAHTMKQVPGATPTDEPAGDGQTVDGVPTLIIGPEGGFDPGELEYFRDRGWSSYKLGRNVLRIETAAVAALALLAAEP